MLDLTAPVEQLAAQLVDIPSVSDDEQGIADAVETALAAHPHLEVTRDGDAIVARFGALGIPAVNYGPGDPELAHTINENCPVADIHACRAALKAWLTE